MSTFTAVAAARPRVRTTPSFLALATCCALLVAALVQAVPATAAPGALDTAWGAAGLSGTTDGRHLSAPFPGSLVQLPDGKLLTAGVHTSFGFDPDRSSFSFRLQPTVTRTNPDGSLDTTWGAGGVAAPYLDDHAIVGVRALPQADGGVVLVGAQVGLLTAKTVVARLDARGALDPAFGHGGYVTTLPEALDDLVPVAATTLPDGRIEVVATSLSGDLLGLVDADDDDEDAAPAKAAADIDVALVRYLPTGALDPSFGSGGIVQYDSRNATSQDIALTASFAPDGAAVVGGTTYYTTERTVGLLVRFTAAGAPDTAFGTSGRAPITGSDARAIEAVTALSPLAADGSLFAAVEHTRAASDDDGEEVDELLQPYVRHVGGAGQLLAFGRTKLGAALPPSSAVTTLATTADGAVLAGGTAPIGAGSDNGLNPAVARLTPGGRLDATFDTGGVAVPAPSIDDELHQGFVTGIAPQVDGSLLVAGAWNGVARIARLYGASAGGAGTRRPGVLQGVLRDAPRTGCGARAHAACIAPTGVVTLSVLAPATSARHVQVRVGEVDGSSFVNEQRHLVTLDAHGRGVVRLDLNDFDDDTVAVRTFAPATAGSVSGISRNLYLTVPSADDDEGDDEDADDEVDDSPRASGRVTQACALSRRSATVIALDVRAFCTRAGN